MLALGNWGVCVFETLIAFLTENAVVLGAVGSIVFLIGWTFGIIKAPFKRDKPVALAPDTIQQIAQQQSKNGAALTTAEFIRVRRELKADIEAELARAPDAEKGQLRSRSIRKRNKSLPILSDFALRVVGMRRYDIGLSVARCDGVWSDR